MKDLYIDERCEALITHAENYHEGAGGKPCHNNSCKVCSGASHGADSLRTMFMAKHLGLIEPYLTGGKVIHLPDFVGEAENHAEQGWETANAAGGSESLLWGGVR